MKILIHTPISNRAWCFPQWFDALKAQVPALPGAEVSMLFELNDSYDETERLLMAHNSSAHPFKNYLIRKRSWTPTALADHQWSAERYSRMIRMRNLALWDAAHMKYDFLFSLDSDVLLHEPDTLAHLIEADQPIIAGVFTAKWGNADADALPNVWQTGQNEMTDEFLREAPRATVHFTVGGLGACTLIRKDVLATPWINYSPIYNLPRNYRGEDRNFCVRAAVAGITLKACAHKRIEHLDRLFQKKESETV